MNKHSYSQVFIDNGWGDLAGRHFRARRERLAKQVPGPIVLWGVPHSAGHPYSWAVVRVPVFQDPFLLYLTGINQPGIAIGMCHKSDGTITDVLFLPKKDPKSEFWEGARFGFEARSDHHSLRDLTGFSQVLPMTQLKSWVVAQSKSSQKAYSFWHKFKPKSIQQFDRWAKSAGFSVESLANSRWQSALEFDPQDIANLRAAHAKTAKIFLELVKAIPTAKSERDIDAVMAKEITLATPYGPSFSPIIAAGANAATLHYTKNDDAFGQNELLLLDFGIRSPLIVTDVTRTIPISGKYTPLQRLLYTIVLDVQMGVEKQVKPGVSIQILNEWCWNEVSRLLDDRFYAHGGKAKMAYTANKPHFVSHLIGYAVHDGDPTREYRHQPLIAGMIISNEPGIYGEFELTIDGVRHRETIGIRIEDDLLLTPTGCENLSAAIPKSVAEIENLVSLAYRNAE